jgi:hypothetical protein
MKRLIAIIFLLATSVLLLAPPLLAQWEPDVRLTTDDSVSRTPNVAADSSGTIHVAWSDDRNGGRNHADIFYKRSTDRGTTWFPDTNLTSDPSDSRFPVLATSGSAVHLLWQNKGVPNWELHYRRSTDRGTTWSRDTILSEVTSDTSESWDPTLTASGTAVHAAWADARDGSPEIYYKRSLDGGTSWGPDTRLTFDPGFSMSPSIAASGSTVHLVWSDDRSGNDNIYYKRSTDAGGTWDPDKSLTQFLSAATDPAVSASGSLVHLVWVNDGADVFYKNSADNGSHWSAGTRFAAGTGNFPSLSASGNNVHTVWVDDRDVNFEIYYKRNQETEVRLTDDSHSSETPSVCASGLGVHVVWSDNRDGNYEIYYKRNSTGNVGTKERGGRGDKETGRQNYSALPNPFSSFTTVPGHERERFEMYDAAGRKVGTYRGDRIGVGLASGVYFLKPEGKDVKPIRVVKLR